MSSDSTDRLRILSPAEDESAIDLDLADALGEQPGRQRAARSRVRMSRADRQTLLGGGIPDATVLASLAHPRSALQTALLTDALPINPIRESCRAAYTAARLAQDECTVALAVEAATTVDARRAALISRLMDDFAQNYPELDEQIVAVVEGGATLGDPECQGLFGDIDFTVFVRSGAHIVPAVGDALRTSFAWTGYPVSESGYNATLDFHIFVQPALAPSARTFFGGAECGSSLHERGEVDAHNPERFVTDAGLRWIVNQMFFAGRPLRGLVERACQPVSIAQDQACDLARDIRCHLGMALTAGSAGEANPRAHPVAVERQRLTAALSASKHVLRLVDALLIGDPLGNALYHDRFVFPRHRTRGTSYHARIVQDALRLIEVGRAGPLRAQDSALLHDLAQLKLRSQYLTPWDYLGYGADGWERARSIVGSMRELVLRIDQAMGLSD